MLPVLFALTLAPACNRGGSQPPDAPASEVPAGFEGAPEGAAGIAALLGARHTEDLPTREVLDKHAEPVESLAWLAREGGTATLRVRAVRSLGLYYPMEEGALLAEYAASAPPPLRAAALRALADWPAEPRFAYEGVIRRALGHEDPRVDAAARAASKDLPAADEVRDEPLPYVEEASPE